MNESEIKIREMGKLKDKYGLFDSQILETGTSKEYSIENWCSTLGYH